MEKHIQKVIIAQKNLKDYNVDKLHIDLPSYILKEYIDELI
ncbi:MAG: hypothetical protein ACOZBL_03465 [Patescibacteria group bacterium]